MSPPRTLCLVLLVLFAQACSHNPFNPEPNLKTDAEAFDKALRFQDYADAAQLVVAARRQVFLAARRKEGTDLEVTDMEVIDVQMTPDGKQATVVSRMRWVKLPSVSEVTAEVHASWTLIGNQWFLVSLAGGPFPELDPSHH
ncbi:MAG: hypothetical protein ACLQDQ_10915 [Myxococcaceae bacterium]